MQRRLIYSLLGAVILSIGGVYAQNNFKIRGEVNSSKPLTWAYLYKFEEGRQLLDSVPVKDNQFEFVGRVDKAYSASIGVKGIRRSVSFYLEPATFYTRIEEDWAKPSPVIGGVQNAIAKGYEAENKRIQDTMAVLGSKYEHADAEGKVKLSLLMEEWSEQLDSTRFRYIENYPNSLAIIEINRPYFAVLNYLKLQRMKSLFDTSLSYSSAYQELDKYYEQKKSEYLVGQPAPAVRTKTVDGKSFDLAALKGKVVLIDFWASWCAPCRVANRKLVPTYEKYKTYGFEIVSVSMDDKENLWKEAIKKDGIPWIQVSELKGIKGSTIAEAYSVRQLPTLFLIDEKGKVIHQNMDHEDLLNYLKSRYEQ